MSYIKEKILRLEGQQFLILKSIDRCVNLYEYPELKRKLEAVQSELDDYRSIAPTGKTNCMIQKKIMTLLQKRNELAEKKRTARTVVIYKKLITDISMIDTQITDYKNMLRAV